MIDEILNYYESKNMMHPHLRFRIQERWVYLESQKEFTRRRMREIIQEYNFHNLPNVTQPSDKVYQISFSKGVDNFSIWFGLSDVVDSKYDDEPVFKDDDYGLFDKPMDEEEVRVVMESLKKKSDKTKKKINAIPVDEKKYPKHLNDYFLKALSYFFLPRLTYAWLGYQWQEIGGCEIGMNAATWENNSSLQYSFNDFCFEDLSNFTHPQEVISEFIPPAFNRKLSFTEIFIRTGIQSPHRNSFTNKWKYLERDKDFVEIGLYRNKTGIRKGKVGNSNTPSNFDIEVHREELRGNFSIYQSQEMATKFLANFCTQKINEGWVEKFRPLDSPKQLFKLAVDFPYFQNRKSNLSEIEFDQIRLVEKENNIVFENAFRAFLLYFNGDIGNGFSFFNPMSETSEVISFYPLERISSFLHSNNLRNLNYLLPIGETNSNQSILLDLKVEKEQLVYIENSESHLIKISESFYSFINNKRYQNWFPF